MDLFKEMLLTLQKEDGKHMSMIRHMCWGALKRDLRSPRRSTPELRRSVD